MGLLSIVLQVTITLLKKKNKKTGFFPEQLSLTLYKRGKNTLRSIKPRHFLLCDIILKLNFCFH